MLRPPRIGRTHLAITFGTKTILAGHNVYFGPVPDMVVKFQRARDENSKRGRRLRAMSARSFSRSAVAGFRKAGGCLICADLGPLLTPRCAQRPSVGGAYPHQHP
jgi:hypothetical protein